MWTLLWSSADEQSHTRQTPKSKFNSKVQMSRLFSQIYFRANLYWACQQGSLRAGDHWLAYVLHLSNVFALTETLAILDKWGCLPIDPIRPNFKKISSNYSTKTKLKGGPLYDKNCQHVYLGPHNVDHFKQKGVAANRPKMNHFWILNNFLYKFKFKGGIFYGKNWHLMYLGPYGAGSFGYAHACRPAKIGPFNIIFMFVLNLKN